VFLYWPAQLRKRTEHFFFTSGSDRSDVPQTRSRSRRGSSAKARWKRGPAFWMRPSSRVSARSWRWTLPYFSFFRMARAASAGPDPWSLMTSTRSGMPLRSSSSYDSAVSRSTVTVTAEYGFFCWPTSACCRHWPTEWRTIPLDGGGASEKPFPWIHRAVASVDDPGVGDSYHIVRTSHSR